MKQLEHPHPGQQVMLALRTKFQTQAAAAIALGISDAYLSDVLRGMRPLSAQLAVKLEEAGLELAETWLVLQARYEVAKLKRDHAIEKRRTKKAGKR